MNEQTKEKWDNWEKVISVALGVIGVLAILFKYFKSGFDLNELLDATVNFSQVAIPVLVMFLTMRILKKPDFYQLLENAIQLWAFQNRYLIDEEMLEEGEGKRRWFYILSKKNHRNFVTQKKLARDFSGGGQLKDKGAFLSIDKLTKNILEIRLNESLFKEEAGEVLEYSLKDRASDLMNGIHNNFGQVLKLTPDSFQIKEKGRMIIITLGKLDKSEKEVGLIVDMLEYMKTAILAMA